MANTVAIQTILDGPRNAVVKVTGTLDTSDLANFVIADPAVMQGVDNTGALKAAKLRIVRSEFFIKDTLEVSLLWDATVPVVIETLTGRGKLDAKDYQGLTNNAGAGNIAGVGVGSAGEPGKKSVIGKIQKRKKPIDVVKIDD